MVAIVTTAFIHIFILLCRKKRSAEGGGCGSSISSVNEWMTNIQNSHDPADDLVIGLTYQISETAVVYEAAVIIMSSNI